MAGPPAWKRALDGLRWIPFVFIIALVAFAWTVLIHLHATYTLGTKGWYITSLINTLLSTFLAGMTIWSFVVAVFKNPGNPLGVRPATLGWDTRSAVEESHWERHHRLQEERARDGGAHTTDAHDEDGETEGDLTSDNAPLLEQHRTGERADPQADAFDAPLLPGQPQVPARTGRAQLNDVLSLVERARGERLDRRVFLSDLQVKNTGERRWCKQCNTAKPDRAHHCSSCGVCVLRMDHHCPWLASRCIGLRNHKAFFLFLFYTALLCCFAAQDCARALWNFVDEEPNGYETTPVIWAVDMFLGVIFGLALVPFCGYHAYLIMRNRTTLENMEGAGRVRISVPRPSSLPPRESVTDRLRRLGGTASPRASLEGRPTGHDDGWRRDEELTREERRLLRKANNINIYDVNVRQNWCSVMGTKPSMWWFPIGEPESDGHRYEVNADKLQELEEITSGVRDRSAGAQGQNRRTTSGTSASPITSLRSKARTDTHAQRNAQGGTSASHRKAGHDVVQWGAPPKKDFVLFGLGDDEDDESGGVLSGQAKRQRGDAPPPQMDADVWSS